MLPNGTYIGKANAPLIWSNSPNSGSPQLVIKLSATKGEMAGGTADFIGSLVGGAEAITRRQAEACGFDGDDDASVMKNEVSFKVYTENWNGKEQTRVQIMTGVEYKQMSVSDAAAAKARFKAGSAAPKKAAAEEEDPF